LFIFLRWLFRYVGFWIVRWKWYRYKQKENSLCGQQWFRTKY